MQKTEENSFRDEEPPLDEKDFDTHEEEIRNKYLLEKLKEEQTRHREFVKQLEIEKRVKEELAEEQRQRELRANQAYIARRNASAKFRAKETNERLSKMLAKVEAYMSTIEKLDPIDKIKQQAQKEYEEELKKKKKKVKVTDEEIKKLATLNKKNSSLREENIKRRKEREEAERKKKEKIQKANKLNEKIKTILEKGYTTNNVIENNKNSLFQEEDNNIGTNMSPDMYNENNNTSTVRAKSSKQTRLLPPISETNDINAENELRQILKNDKNNMKKLLDFKRKYKNFDISSYLHTAKMNQIKSAKSVKRNVVTKQVKNFTPTSSSSYPSYLLACKYNNNEYIQAHLLNAKDDVDVFAMLNEKDEYERKGLMYLIIHNNLTMIKLSLLSGVILSDCKDIYGRNLIHYCCRSVSSTELLDVICHCIVFENKEDFSSMNRYVNKCMMIAVNSEESNIEECEKRIKECDEEIANMDLAVNPEEIRRKEKEEEEKQDAKLVSVNGKVNKANSKLTGGNVVITNTVNIGEEIRRKKVPTGRLINSADIDGNYPIHYCAHQNDFDKIKILIYYNVKLDVVDRDGKKAIDITTSEVIQQYLLKNEKNVQSKNEGLMSLNATTNMNKSMMSKVSLSSMKALDMDKIKFYSTEQINSFSTGYENNNYLILSVLQNNYDAFKYLLTEKGAKVDFVNSNGFTVLYFILQNRYYSYFALLFGLVDEEVDSDKILLEQVSQKSYTKQDIYKSNGELTYTGEAFKILDTQTNTNLNLLTLSIDTLNSLDILKAIMVLYTHQQTFFPSSSPIDIIMNRKYGKNQQPLLVKAVEHKNIEMVKYLLNEAHKNYCTFDIYQGDIKNMNMLHYAILNKDKPMIQFLICYDAEKNVMRKAKDAKGKIPSDYDNGKIFTNEYHHIWDACSQNDIDLLDKLVSELKYYDVNDTLPICKYTPLHVAAMHCADKVCLYLVKKGCDVNRKNKKKLTALEMVKNDPTKPKSFIRKFEKILKKEIKEYVDLDKTLNNTTMNKTNSSKLEIAAMKNKRLKNIIETVKKEFENRKINVKKLFTKLDKNKNGTLEGSEFECLFTVLDIPGISSEDVLLLNSYLDENKNGLIEYEELIKILE